MWDGQTVNALMKSRDTPTTVCLNLISRNLVSKEGLFIFREILVKVDYHRNSILLFYLPKFVSKNCTIKCNLNQELEISKCPQILQFLYSRKSMLESKQFPKIIWLLFIWCGFFIFDTVFVSLLMTPPHPTLGHYQGDNLTHAMLLTSFYCSNSDPKVNGSLLTLG